MLVKKKLVYGIFLVMVIGLAVLFSLPQATAQNQSKVCFYELPNYQGNSYCATPGFDTPDASNIMISGRNQNWNKRIQSIKIIGSAKVTVWEGKNYTGPSIGLVRSEPDLRYVNTQAHGVRNWSKAISSYKTHY